MKILVNLVTLTNSGVIPYWLVKFQELTKLGHEIDLYFDNKIHKTNFLKKNIYNYNSCSEIKTLPYINNKFRYMFYSFTQNLKSFKYIYTKKNDYQLIYTPSSVLDLTIIPFFLKTVNPNIIWTTVFDNIVPITDPGNKITRFIAWVFFKISLLLIKKADIVYTISADLNEYLLDKGFSQKKIVITGNGIESNLIKKAKIDKKLSYDGLFVGRINETKGIFDMLKVLKIIKQKYPKFVLAIMGNGDDETVSKFKKKIKIEKLNKNIKFLGYISGQKKFNIIKSCKSFWFLSVSKSESFGIALMEAVVSGICAFVYDLPVFKNLYKNNEVFFSPKHNTKSVAEKILKIFDSKNFENQKGKKLLDSYSWNHIVEIENNAISRLNKN